MGQRRNHKGNLKIFTDEPCSLEISRKDFPGGSVVKNLPVNAGDTGSLAPRKSHMPQGNYARVSQLQSPRSTTRKPTCPRTCAPQKKPQQGKGSPCTATAEWPPLAATRESPRIGTKN